jgi:NTE family protein
MPALTAELRVTTEAGLLRRMVAACCMVLQTVRRAVAEGLASGRRARGLPAPIASRRPKKTAVPVKRLNLALQGGGAHGAFTWGALDRLLEDGRADFDGISGTSAGAVNAVLLAAGLMEGGAAAARAKLETFWRNISHGLHGELMTGPVLDAMSGPPGQTWGTPGQIFGMVSRFLSPYQLNPFDYNPLRQQLEELVNFQRLRRNPSVRMFIAATDIASGRRRIFENGELTIDTVLASACLPTVHHAVKVGTRFYWDGGYTANPVLLPLVQDTEAADTLLIQVIPLTDLDVPTTQPEIYERLNRIVFNAPLRQEIEMIALGQSLSKGLVIGNRSQRRFRRHRFHRIDAAPYTQGLEPGSRLNPDWGMISRLRESGRHAAEEWLERQFHAVGKTGTADFAAIFL